LTETPGTQSVVKRWPSRHRTTTLAAAGYPRRLIAAASTVIAEAATKRGSLGIDVVRVGGGVARVVRVGVGG
jgi:hypothetical protein